MRNELCGTVWAKVGDPLVYLDDQVALNNKTATPLNMSIDPNYIIKGVFKDDATGLDVIVAYNKTTNNILVSAAGTNGFGKDMPDTAEDIYNIGLSQAQQLFAAGSDFTKLITDLQNGAATPPTVVVGGQSLGAAVASYITLGLTTAVPSLNDGANNGVPLFAPSQVTGVGLNGPGTQLMLNQLGVSSEQTKDVQFLNVVVQNTANNNSDLVSQTGGNYGFGNTYVWQVNAPDVGNVGSNVWLYHGINGLFAQGFQQNNGDFQTLVSVNQEDLPHLDTASVSAIMHQMPGMFNVQDNVASLSSYRSTQLISHSLIW